LRDDLQALTVDIIQDLIFNGPDLIEDVDDLPAKKKEKIGIFQAKLDVSMIHCNYITDLCNIK
jgi:hypothetical protein